MSRPSTAVSEPAVRTQPAQLTLLLVGDDRIRDRLERAFSGDETELAVETVVSPAAVAERSEIEADCLVIASPAATAETDAPETGAAAEAAAGHLETLRTRSVDLPVVVLADERTPSLADAVRSYDWTAVVERDEPPAQLADRVHDLLERHRLTALSRRSLASVELAGDAIAIVGPDGALQFASRSFAMLFEYDEDTAEGTPWRELFTDDAVDHLESAAIPTVSEGWRWTGRCTGRRKTGGTFAARLRLGGLTDGSLVFAISEDERRDGLED
ncbi:PAS domain-containing protein [Natrinema salaciae]|uniref:PAS domain S-box-containing protein n=1 Tax=Natrinema salaciae TaxID=1186196 RepID=A0A1H9IEE4_9EURY|nr:PAS domain-containing protein [Natrinema salaciae]SEQ72755.1 PAS domain S-box-containing protein [Natrinema salaciae]